MRNSKPKIHWMLDESIGNCKPSEWQRVISCERKLVEIIGNPNFEHTMPDPIEGLKEIISTLDGQSFTTIIDLTGWLHPSLNSPFPAASIVTDFSLSRVRVTSSPNLESSGHLVSMNADEINQAKHELDMRKTLIVDDTTFTGWTNIQTMKLWGLSPETTTHAFLIANTGMLNPEMEVRGAVQELEFRGSRVIWAHKLVTPFDDGWHLKDLHQHPNLTEAFGLGLEILQIIDRDGPESENVKKVLRDPHVLDTLFPNRFSKPEIDQMIMDGRFVPSGRVDLSDEELVHTRNPLLWASRYFRSHINLPKVVDRKMEIADLLVELHTLTNDPEAQSEAASELRNIVESDKISSLEGAPGHGTERR